jgi:hypothetical protein
MKILSFAIQNISVHEIHENHERNEKKYFGKCHPPVKGETYQCYKSRCNAVLSLVRAFGGFRGHFLFNIPGA